MRSRKPTSRQKKSVQKKVDWKALEIVHPDAAGIDVGGSEHWVAVSPERDVYLVNAQHTKNVPGRKSDVQECQCCQRQVEMSGFARRFERCGLEYG